MKSTFQSRMAESHFREATTFKSVKELNGEDLCLKYSDEPEKMKEWLSKLKSEELLYRKEGFRLFFPDDKERRLVLEIKICRFGKEITFNFGMSLNATKQGFYLSRDKLLYNLLTCIRSEFNYPKTIEEFIDEFGYEVKSYQDAKNLENLFQRCTEQSQKLHLVFTEEEISFFPS